MLLNKCVKYDGTVTVVVNLIHVYIQNVIILCQAIDNSLCRLLLQLNLLKDLVAHVSSRKS